MFSRLQRIKVHGLPNLLVNSDLRPRPSNIKGKQQTRVEQLLTLENFEHSAIHLEKDSQVDDQCGAEYTQCSVGEVHTDKRGWGYKVRMAYEFTADEFAVLDGEKSSVKIRVKIRCQPDLPGSKAYEAKQILDFPIN